MRANRIVRIILGLVVLAIFLCYAVVRAAYSPKTRDLPDYTWEEYLSQNFGLRPDGTAIDPTPAASTETFVVDPAATAMDNSAAAPAPEAVPTPEPTVDPASPYGQALANAAAQGLPTPPNVDITSWEYTLVNGDHSIGEYVPEQLAYLNTSLSETDIQYSYNDQRCAVDARIAEALVAMGRDCIQAGNPVYLSSGYRSYSEQAQNFQRICQNNGVPDGKNYEGYYITMPAGCSEHQLALCCDITDKYYQIKNDQIVASSTIQWLLAHCSEYGFVQRFPDGKQEVTKVMNESWHFRYVGPEAARYMTDNNLCLEEFLALYGVV